MSFGVAAFLTWMMKGGGMAFAPLLDDTAIFFGRHVGKLTGKKPGFGLTDPSHHNFVEKIGHLAGSTPFWAAAEAASVVTNLGQGFNSYVQGSWDQRPDNNQALAPFAGAATGAAWNGAFMGAMAIGSRRRASAAVLGDAYAVREGKWLRRMTPFGVKRGLNNNYILHKDASLTERLYKAEDALWKKTSKNPLKATTGKWELAPHAVAVAGEGAEKSVKAFIKEKGLTSGYLKAGIAGDRIGRGVSFLGKGLGNPWMIIPQLIGGMVLEAGVHAATHIAGSIIDENMNSYLASKKNHRDDRQFNNPMMAQWHQQNYQAAAGAYESNGVSMSRIYHNR